MINPVGWPRSRHGFDVYLPPSDATSPRTGERFETPAKRSQVGEEEVDGRPNGGRERLAPTPFSTPRNIAQVAHA
jgi:hypothetical protein